jgi:LacI family transcriptional regulator
MALGAIGAAEERGFEVGRDLAITGFDDIPPAEFSHVPLTTVHQPIYQIGKMLCDMLVTLIKGEELIERHTILEPSLVIRRSSCPPAG